MAIRCSDTSQPVPSDLVDRYVLYDHLIAVGKRGRARGELYSPRGVAIDSSTNQIYIVEAESHKIVFARVSIFSEMGEFLNTFAHTLMNSPCGIAIHLDNVYVTDLQEHCIFHFKLAAEIRLIARFGIKGTEIGQFRYPKQVAVSANGEIFVADCYNDRIQIMDEFLHYQRHISHRSMTRPRDVKLTSNEVYTLSDEDSPCLHVFTHIGDKIRSLITCGKGMQVARPHFFCLDGSRNLIISDWWSHRIDIFSNEGTFLTTLAQREDKMKIGMVYNPCGIALINNLKLVITSQVSYHVKYGLQIIRFNY